MKLPLAAFALVALLTVPASADPIDITVPGGYVLPDTAPRFHYRDDYVYGDPWDQNFDPAAAAINALNISNFKPPRPSLFNLDRAFTLHRTGDSITGHQLKCQARYASYDMISDTYLGNNGIPRPCRL